MGIDFKYISLSAKKRLPKTEAIYFVICRKNVLYIGTTNNLKSRFKRHHLRRSFAHFKNPYVIWFWNKNSDLELNLIRIFKPLFNQQTPNEHREKNRLYHLFKKHTIYEYVSARKLFESPIVDVQGALKILGISQSTLLDWQEEGFLKGFKTVYNSRLRKCFLISDLRKLAGSESEVSA